MIEGKEGAKKQNSHSHSSRLSQWWLFIFVERFWFHLVNRYKQYHREICYQGMELRLQAPQLYKKLTFWYSFWNNKLIKHPVERECLNIDYKVNTRFVRWPWRRYHVTGLNPGRFWGRLSAFTKKNTCFPIFSETFSNFFKAISFFYLVIEFGRS